MQAIGRAILLDHSPDKTWIEALRRSVLKLGLDLECADEPHLQSVSWRDVRLVLLGSALAVNSRAIISAISSKTKQCRIVVFSSCPSWEEAREALLAGATDYGPIPSTDSALLSSLENALRKGISQFIGG